MAIFIGTSGSDLLNGTSDADTIGGAAGADTLNGAAAADTLTGGTGADRLSGGAGSDLFAFQAGDSVLTIAGIRVGTISGNDVIADFASGENRRQGRQLVSARTGTPGPERWRADSVRTPRRLFVWRVRPTEAYACSQVAREQMRCRRICGEVENAAATIVDGTGNHRVGGGITTEVRQQKGPAGRGPLARCWLTER
jgi:RTX calcium-binding nonapeptide repeat (4 copies)